MKDPLGEALWDFHKLGRASDVVVQSPDFDDDIIPTAHFFRTWEQMPLTEQKALEQVRGRVLDVGAGAGCHSLYLQEKNIEVKAIDISPKACQCMTDRAVSEVECIPFLDFKEGKFDTILFLMNGIGIEGMEKMASFFEHLKSLLNPNGQVIFDSSDLRFLYPEKPEVDVDDLSDYYGQFQFRMSYRETVGDYFNWAYVDSETMNVLAEKNGFSFEKIYENEHYAYVAKMTLLS